MKKNSQKKRIGIDLDDVILNFNDNLCIFHNTHYGTNHTRETFTTFELAPFFGCDDDEVVRRIVEFYQSDLHHEAPPVDGAKEFIDKGKDKHDFFIITARPDKFKDLTLAWINKHFPGVFKDVLFANHDSKTGASVKKSEFCKQHGIELFIDDALHNVNDVAEHGIETILFDKPWNREGYVHPKVRRVYSWEDIDIA